MFLVFRRLCPNCGEDIDSERLMAGIPCRKCLPNVTDVKELDKLDYVSKVLKIKKLLLDQGSLNGYWNIIMKIEEFKEFENFFKKITGFRMWDIQKTWAKRLLSNENFALIAPTGVGKSTLLMVYALFRVYKNQVKVIFLLPTLELAKQTFSRLRTLRNSINQIQTFNIISTTELKGTNKKDVIIEALRKRKPSIIIMTNQFFIRNLKEYVLNKGLFVDLLIVDDFDALLKSSKTIDAFLSLIGIPPNAITLAKSIVNLKGDLIYYKVIGDEEKVSEIKTSINKLSCELSILLSNKRIGQLIVSSATGRGRSGRTRILRELLGFEVGSITNYLRNVIDVYSPLSNEALVNIIKELYGGTLIYVAKGWGSSKLKELKDLLNNEGIQCSVANNRKALNELRKGNVKVLIGVATYYGILVRGIDEPLKVYNAIFYGIPRFEIDLESKLKNPLFMLTAINELSSKYSYVFNDEIYKLVRRIRTLRPRKLKVLANALKYGLNFEGPFNDLLNQLIILQEVLKNAILNLLKVHKKIIIGESIIISKGNSIKVLIPDVMTYIQASGRTSRLLNGRMTLGLSIILVDDQDLFNIFLKKLSYYLTDIEFKELRKVNLKDIIELQKKSRVAGAGYGKDIDKIKSALMVVESPTKARTIANLFGKASKRVIGRTIIYETTIPLPNGEVYVTSIVPSIGHVFDLVTSEGLHGLLIEGKNVRLIYSTIKRCLSCGKQFIDENNICPYCGKNSLKDSMLILKVLQKLAQEVDTIFIGTDPDTEGEKIAFDIFLILKPYNNNLHRIEFHEITKKAIIEAIMNSRTVNENLVKAQIVRRVDDRVIGFEISRHLWRVFNKHWLGAGRVQTPVLNWIVSNYLKYKSERGYVMRLKLFTNAPYIKFFVKSKAELEEIIRIINKEGVRLRKKYEIIEKLNPKPPYTTDELLSDSSKKLGLPTPKVMKIMQELFELGYITYHRTDSTHVSRQGIRIAKEYLAKFNLATYFTPKRWGGVGTHECIRPTRPLTSVELLNISFPSTYSLTENHLRIYDLIVRRFVASQMPSSTVKKVILELSIGKMFRKDIELYSKIIDEGFTKVYNDLKIVEELDTLPKTFTVKPIRVYWGRGSRVTLLKDSDVIKLMKEKRIGRPSTYVKALNANIEHGYVILSKKRNYLIPTKLGIEVNDYLQNKFHKFVNEQATRDLEVLVDKVSNGVITPEAVILKIVSDAHIINEDLDKFINNLNDTLLTYITELSNE